MMPVDNPGVRALRETIRVPQTLIVHGERGSGRSTDLVRLFKLRYQEHLDQPTEKTWPYLLILPHDRLLEHTLYQFPELREPEFRPYVSTADRVAHGERRGVNRPIGGFLVDGWALLTPQHRRALMAMPVPVVAITL